MKRGKHKSITLLKMLMPKIPRLPNSNIGENLTRLYTYGIDIGHTRCLQKDITYGIVLKTATRVIKDDNTIIVPIHLSTRHEVMMNLRDIQDTGKIERTGRSTKLEIANTRNRQKVTITNLNKT